MSNLCIWTLDEWHDCWDTACGQCFCMTEGPPHENEYKYCPACGGELIEKWPEREVTGDE